MVLLDQLRSFNPEHLQLVEMLALRAFGQLLVQEYDQHTLEHPEWLDDTMRVLNREIASSTRDAIEKRLKEIAAAKTRLMSADERRKALDAEEAALRAKIS